MLDSLLYQLQSETTLIKEILPPVKVIEFFSTLAKYDNSIKEFEIGEDKSGRKIYRYSIGNGPADVLFYAFPDPGEALGGTGIVSIVNLLHKGAGTFNHLPVTWHFIPCLNFVDQPNEGKTLEKVMKTKSQEVDWCLNNPRPETTALLKAIEEIKPKFTFAMHDEYHSENAISPYIGVTKNLAEQSFNRIRQLFKRFNLNMNPDYSDKEMGEGFFNMSSIGEEYKNCTYSEIEKYGQVFIAELSQHEHLSPAEIVFLQLSMGFIALAEVLPKA
jgi:hypothetical protein